MLVTATCLIHYCLERQHIVLEYARTVLGIDDAQHAEYGNTAAPLIVTPLSCSLEPGQNLEILVELDSHAGRIYGRRRVWEQFWCTFGLNRAYQVPLHNAGLRITGVEPDGEARIVEVPQHRFFVGTLFIPQLNSTAAHPHPLIVALMKEAMRVWKERGSAQHAALSALA